MKGLIAGGQFGANYQTGNAVLGFEADVQWSPQKARVITTSAGATFTDDTKTPWFGTARARLGYAADYMLIYGTAGVAYGEYDRNTALSGALNGAFRNSTTQFGWAFGGGVEGMITKNWTWRAEFLRVQFGKFNQDFIVTSGGVEVGRYTVDTRLTNDIMRVGLNYFIR